MTLRPLPLTTTTAVLALGVLLLGGHPDPAAGDGTDGRTWAGPSVPADGSWTHAR